MLLSGIRRDSIAVLLCGLKLSRLSPDGLDASGLQSCRGQPYDRGMVVQLSHPQRQVEVKGPKRTKDLLRELNLVIEAHLVIRDNDLVTEDEMLSDTDHIEIRPVISGG